MSAIGRLRRCAHHTVGVPTIEIAMCEGKKQSAGAKKARTRRASARSDQVAPKINMPCHGRRARPWPSHLLRACTSHAWCCRSTCRSRSDRPCHSPTPDPRWRPQPERPPQAWPRAWPQERWWSAWQQRVQLEPQKQQDWVPPQQQAASVQRPTLRRRGRRPARTELFLKLHLTDRTKARACCMPTSSL